MSNADFQNAPPFTPVSPEEQAILIKRIKDNPEDLEARDRMIKAYSRMAWSIGIKIGRGLDEDQMRSIVLIAIDEALLKFDPERGVALAVFMRRHITGRCQQMWSRRAKRAKVHKKFLAKRESVDWAGNQFAQEGDRPMRDLLLEFIEGSGAGLTDNERIVVMMILDGLFYSDIGSLLGFSGQRAEQIYNRAVAKIKKWLATEAITNPERFDGAGVDSDFILRAVRKTGFDFRKK